MSERGAVPRRTVDAADRPVGWLGIHQRLSQPRSRLRRLLRMSRAAFDFTREAGLRAGARRALSDLRRLVPFLAAAGWRHAWPQGDLYRHWRRRHEPGAGALAQQRQAQRLLPQRPLISILTPVSGPAPPALRDTLASVLAQTYDHWELCLADAAPGGQGVAALLAKAPSDPRVRVERVPRILGSSGNANAALAMATGEFVLLLDPADTLAPDLLYAVAQRLNEAPGFDALYFDEDSLNQDGLSRREPWFKPQQWSPAMLLSTNVLRHAVMRRQIVVDLGGFDAALDGAYDWDLALRFTEHTQRLVHLPQVGYHRRQTTGTAVCDANTAPGVVETQRQSLAAHLARQGATGARVSFTKGSRVRVHWPVPDTLVSIIIHTRDDLPMLRACLESIVRLTTAPRYEILLVDTGSVEPETHVYYAELLATGRPVRVVQAAGEFNVAAANNQGARQAVGEHLIFLNNDVEVLDPDWLEELVGWSAQPGVGLVGAKLLRPDGTLGHAGTVIGLVGHAGHIFDGCPEETDGPFGSSEWYRDCLAVTGTGLAVRRAVFEQLEGFDEAYQLGGSELELGLRAVSQGLRVVYTPFARLRHNSGLFRALDNLPTDVLRAYWQALPIVQQGDPFFSPHLSGADSRPTVARPHSLGSADRLEMILSDHDLLHRPLPVAHAALKTIARPATAFAAETVTPSRAEKVLLISHDLSLTGAPLMLMEAAKALGRAGYRVSVLAPVDGALRETLTHAGVPVCIEPALLDDARAAARHFGGQVLVVANTILAWRVVLAAKAAQVPCLWWIHESFFGEAQVRRQPGLARALAMAEQVLLPSHGMAGWYAGHVPADRVAVVHNGLSMSDMPLASLTAPVAAGPDRLTIVNLASLEPRKAQAMLLASVANLPVSLRERTHVVLLGRPLQRGYFRRLQRMAARMGPEQVKVLGVQPRGEALAQLRAADVFVLSSRDEGFPVTLLEAMALGKAIIATRVGGIMEAVQDGTEALLVPANDPAALTAALTRLLNDQALRERLGQAARARFDRSFTGDHFGAGLVTLVRQMIAARQARGRPDCLGQREASGELPVAYRLRQPRAPADPLLETTRLIW